MNPADVEGLVGVPTSLLVRRGEARIPGGSPFTRSVALWQLEFTEAPRVDEMIPALLSYVGGTEHLAMVKQRVAPELFEVDIAMWNLGSEEQEGGSIDAPTIALLGKLGASLSFALYRQNDI